MSGRWKRCVIEGPIRALWFTKNGGTKRGEPLSSTLQVGYGCPPLSGAGRVNVLYVYPRIRQGGADLPPAREFSHHEIPRTTVNSVRHKDADPSRKGLKQWSGGKGRQSEGCSQQPAGATRLLTGTPIGTGPSLIILTSVCPAIRQAPPPRTCLDRVFCVHPGQQGSWAGQFASAEKPRGPTTLAGRRVTGH